ncbi:hypothetical protein CRE_14062 [Caenorhabditis remanei]|uniref:Rho-GAP domain-containing protein n=1 Tax=Caenorhabditis remanei TaxID=31234 RepID=E3MRB7_CAERE|nr:hypothetical protein CRE_14062 [Caenorhabditis remanei]
MVSEPEDYADFRILATRCPSGSKKNSMAFDATNGMARYRFSLGEVLSWNIDLDVIVGNGWTRITLREIPRFLVDALDRVMAKGLDVDGIFRKEGSSVRLNKPEILEIYRGMRPIPDDFTVWDVCTMVKRFLKDLKPTLLNSDNVRMNILRKAKMARETGEFELSHLEMVEIFESTGRHLSPSHPRNTRLCDEIAESGSFDSIAKHSDTHKMTTDNLAVVLVGSVFGDFMTSGGTESRKKMQQVKKCTEADLMAKKEDMGVQVAAVKLLIVNANLIGLPHGHYVSSNRLHLNNHHLNVRSTSAMPTVRCTSVSDNEQTPTSSNTPKVFNMAKASMMHQIHPNSDSQKTSRNQLTRRDSDLTHMKAMKPREPVGTKRSSSFLPIPSLRGLRDRVSNQFLKRNKSPSPDKLRRQLFKPQTSADTPHMNPSSSANLPPPPLPPDHSTPIARRHASGVDSDVDDNRRAGDANRSIQKQGSTSSGRKSRTHTKKGNINSAMKGNQFDSDSQKSFQMSPNPMEKRTSISSTSSTITNRSLRRISQSDQNSFTRGDATPPKKKKSGSGTALTRRNTADGLRKDHNHHNRDRRPTRRPTYWGVDTITEEKENRRSVITIDDLQSEEEDPKEKSMMEGTFENEESVLELMNSQARLRRVGVAERRQRRIANANSGPSDSMMVLNGSMAAFEKLPPTPQSMKVTIGKKGFPGPIIGKSPSKSQQEYPTVFETPIRGKEELRVKSMTSAKSKIGQQLEREMKQRLDVVATPMLSRRTASESVAHRVQITQQEPLTAIPLRKLDSIGVRLMISSITQTLFFEVHQHGHAWVGKSQTVVSSPIQRNQVEKTKEAEKVSPILARSPLFRSPSTATPTNSEGRASPFFGFRSKSHLTEDRIFSNQEYAALATPPRERRIQSRPARLPQSNLIYSSPKMKPTDHLTSTSPLLTRSSSMMTSCSPCIMTGNRHQAHLALSPLVQSNNTDDSQTFKCPFLPPMKSHESKERKKNTSTSSSINRHSSTPRTPRISAQTADSSTELGFGDFNEIIKNSTEDTKFPLLHQPVEARPSVTALRSSACGLVQSRINHFQTIERTSISNRRVSTDMSTSGGRPSGVSTTSLKSIDTTTSSSGKL